MGMIVVGNGDFLVRRLHRSTQGVLGRVTPRHKQRMQMDLEMMQYNIVLVHSFPEFELKVSWEKEVHGEGEFELKVKRSLSLVNKYSTILKDEYLIPGSWWIEKNKRIVLDENGDWILASPLDEDQPVPKF
ncbi:unnamed protein product [Fraxinus pennsylvanica]|uniref:Phospholipase A1 n=1 Tax=Fraxinus pennsylvanica TaxID=56036 RepID=A0AAD2DYE1_9LAMI|nr:unnamed protein product [Fraxinus pennsylvanica]